MTHELRFAGISSADDCATCLQGYDLQEFEADSGWPHTRFFFPKAFAAGLRMASEGDTLWRVFFEEHRRAQQAGSLEIPMEYFARAVHWLFLQGPGCDAVDFGFSDQLWEEAVTASGYRRARLK